MTTKGATTMKTRLLHTFDANCDKCKGVCVNDASSNPTHTPTNEEDLMLPWIQGDSTPGDEQGDNACNIYDEDSGGNVIANCINPETAAFIVRVVKDQDALLESLRECVQLMGENVNYQEDKDFKLAVDSAYEAIAKAEGK